MLLFLMLFKPEFQNLLSNFPMNKKQKRKETMQERRGLKFAVLLLVIVSLFYPHGKMYLFPKGKKNAVI